MKIEKVVISEFGETVIPHSGDVKASDTFGLLTHEHCNGWVDIVKISDSHSVLYCRNCAMRVAIPLEIKTWGELLKYFYFI